MALTLERIQAAAKGDNSILENKALLRAVEEAEQDAAKDKLVPFLKAMDKLVTKSQADGTLVGDAVEFLPLVTFELEQDDKGTVKGIKSIIATSARRGSGGGSKISSKTWGKAGFVTFLVNGSEVPKPKDAIVAAGGSPRKVKSGKNVGKDANENYWRVILDNGDDGFVNLPIKVRVAQESGDTETITLKDMKARVNA